MYINHPSFEFIRWKISNGDPRYLNLEKKLDVNKFDLGKCQLAKKSNLLLYYAQISLSCIFSVHCLFRFGCEGA